VKEVFEKVQLGFLIVGHTHEDIDESFSYFSKKMKNKLCVSGFDESVYGFAKTTIHYPTNSRNPNF
jgi:hypothetical protein